MAHASSLLGVLFFLLSTNLSCGENNDHLNAVVTLSGGEFRLGSESADEREGELSASTVKVQPFVIDKYPVTNQNYRDFVRATQFKTFAEEYRWSFVFHSFVPMKVRAEKDIRPLMGAPWWLPVPRAYWREPAGPGTSIKEKMSYPVVHTSYTDAKAYCEWVGKRLPTEAEWEFAARGGLKENEYPWGQEVLENRMNTWQGKFPDENTEKDGYLGVAPVDAFPPQNTFGMYDMIGNAWEWVSDEFKQGPMAKTASQPMYVLRGGSYLDTVDGIHNHRVSVTTRMGNTADAGSDNITFRCARSAAKDEL